MLSVFDRVVVPFCDDGISEVEQYGSALRNLHSQAVVDAQSNFVPNRFLGTTPSELLSSSVCSTLAQLRLGHCRLLNSYKARITAGVTDVCPDHTPLNICSSALPARHNWQLETYGTIQMRWLIFSSSTTTNEGDELWATTTTTWDVGIPLFLAHTLCILIKASSDICRVFHFACIPSTVNIICS